MSKLIRYPEKIIEQRKSIFFITVIAIYLLLILERYLEDYRAVYLMWDKQTDGRVSAGELIGLINKEFSIADIFSRSSLTTGQTFLLISLISIPIAIFLRVILSKYLLEKHAGWKKIYMVAIISFAAFFGASQMFSPHIEVIMVTLYLLWGAMLGGVIVLCVRWISTEFEKKGSV